ncbi:MAG: hypothetical protein JRN26_03235 [Nitrososphaerota archaeon]|jgi:hypothetical protein|nr:hypothetical protein [Nitrososphaerota archaeon]MDG6927104.1 hypothetical protein [Nitrososphaerota archaeon]MDG6929903.1 hypothetical protein [Nitrososphaerota archaeon]MDG6932329.1 hypothetical protein [Nitrososphaerota archaeon]MDG6935888.1 hypothetical protein [Nitrososphaerota archaeon]
MRVKIAVEIRLNGNPAKLDGLKKALEPDNVGIPEGMTLKIKKDDGQLIILTEGNMGRIPSILNTLDEIILLAKSSLETVDDEI